MKAKNQKTAAVTFKTTPEKKEALVSAAKAARMDLSPYIEQQLELLFELLEGPEVKALLDARRSRTATFLNKDGKRVYVTLDSASDVLRYYVAANGSYGHIIAQLVREGRYLYDFASDDEKLKIAKEDEEEQKNSSNSEDQSEDTPKDNK